MFQVYFVTFDLTTIVVPMPLRPWLGLKVNMGKFQGYLGHYDTSIEKTLMLALFYILFFTAFMKNRPS